jgi:hypothetical protein
MNFMHPPSADAGAHAVVALAATLGMPAAGVTRGLAAAARQASCSHFFTEFPLPGTRSFAFE